MVTSAITSATTAASTATSATTATSTDNKTLASNFQTFLTLLTTQLQNQSPLDPLDTNQFTQQLVQFAQVEQQLKANEQLVSLVTMQKATQSTQALAFVGKKAVVDGATAKLTEGTATWRLTSAEAATATVTVKSSTGVTAYSGTFQVNSGQTNFTWDGTGTDGTKWPDGDYTISVVAKNSSGQSVAMTSEIQGTVDTVDLTQSPPLLSIGGKSFTLEQIKRVISDS